MAKVKTFVEYEESGLKYPEKADLDKDKKISSYEKVRGKAVQKAVEKEEKCDKCGKKDCKCEKRKCKCEKVEEKKKCLKKFDEYEESGCKDEPKSKDEKSECKDKKENCKDEKMKESNIVSFDNFIFE